MSFNDQYYPVYVINAADGYAGRSFVAAETVDEANMYIQQYRDSADAVCASGYLSVSESDKLSSKLSCVKGLFGHGIHERTPKDDRFINDDVKLKVGGRKAARISQEQLLQFMHKSALRSGCEFIPAGDIAMESIQANPDLMRSVLSVLCTEDFFIKDNKFNVSSENIETDPGCFEEYEKSCGKNLMGFHTLDNGLTFYGFYMGGDWEAPVFMIMYSDGKRLRLYIPSYGNYVNLDCKCALGSEGYEADEKLEKKYRKLGTWIEEDEQDNFASPLAAMYMAKYNIEPDDDCDLLDRLDFNWNAIKQDIATRVEVV